VFLKPSNMKTLMQKCFDDTLLTATTRRDKFCPEMKSKAPSKDSAVYKFFDCMKDSFKPEIDKLGNEFKKEYGPKLEVCIEPLYPKM
jgi:hypothetical protein